MKLKRLIPCLLALILVLGVLPQANAADLSNVTVSKPARNVILLVPDGMSVSVTTLTRWYQGGESLNLDSMASGLVRTYSADAPIADSAPAGTAMATGFKSHTGFVGVLPDENTMPGLPAIAPARKRAPVATVLEAAKLSGRATGVVATSEIMHATPADFSAHYPDRKAYDILSKQQVYQNMDVVLGAGSQYLKSENRKDGTDLLSIVQQNYQYVTTPAQMAGVTSGKLWGMFANSSLAYEFDRNPSTQPSLAEMTAKAIEVLSKDTDGFFLMVEGSKIDWAAHANDPIGLISDAIAFDDAVGVALNFAKRDGNTLVISATDHGNSGISIGSQATSGDYDKRPLSDFIAPLLKAKLTGEGLEGKFNEDFSNVERVMAEYFGITDLTADEIAAIKGTKAGSMNYTVGPMIAKRANIGFTTGGHTGEDIPLYVYAPGNVSQLTGTVENTDIARYIAKAMDVNLDDVTRKLFVHAGEAAAQHGATISFADSVTDPVLTLTRGGVEVRLLVYTNIATVNGQRVELEGVSVHDGQGNVYIPQSAIDFLIK